MRCGRCDPRFAKPPGYATEATFRMGMQSQIGRAAATAMLQELARNLNVGHLMLLLQFGNMSKELTMRNTRLFAESVVPQVPELLSEWEDRWWPWPMAAVQRAVVPAFTPELRAAE